VRKRTQVRKESARAGGGRGRREKGNGEERRVQVDGAADE